MIRHAYSQSDTWLIFVVGLNDGAAVVVLASADVTKQRGLATLATIVSWGQAGVDPAIMGVGPIEAVRKAVRCYRIRVRVTFSRPNDLYNNSLTDINNAFVVLFAACS